MSRTTFIVDDVERGKEALRSEAVTSTVNERLGVTCEASFRPLCNCVQTNNDIGNKFLAAVHTAYNEHYPLVLTPDIIWTCIAQGFAQHVNLNAEQLRHCLVRHEEKKVLTVRRDDFCKGSASNPWPEVFDSFSEQIKSAIGENIHTLLTPTFTTTGPVEKAAAQIVMMDAFKQYFSYLLLTRCGIPEVTLEGTVEDWSSLKHKAMTLTTFELSWWMDELLPVLDQFILAASGKVDKKFWSSLYKRRGGSGGPYITGWIVTLFPYIKKKRNPYLGSWKDDDLGSRPFYGVTLTSFPSGVTSTPFTWDYLGTQYPMEFHGGFMAVSQDPTTLAVRAEIGWAIADEPKTPAVDMQSKILL